MPAARRIAAACAASAILAILPGACGSGRSAPAPATEIGFTADNGSFAIHPDGSAARTLLTGLPAAKDDADGIVLSPDGTREAYMHCGETGNDRAETYTYGLWVAASNGSDPQQLWQAPNCFQPLVPDADTDYPLPRWSADGTQLAVTTSRLDGLSLELVVIRADDGRARIVTDARGVSVDPSDPWGLAWSPDGRRLVFAAFAADGTDSTTEEVPASGGPVRQVGGAGTYSTPLAWSPDGRVILADELPDSPASLLRPAAANLTGVVAFPVSGGRGRVIYPGAAWAVYSPDGRHIALAPPPEAVDGPGAGPVLIVPSDGGPATAVPSTGSTGRQLAPPDVLTGWTRVARQPLSDPTASYWTVTAAARVAAFGGAYGGVQTPRTVNSPIVTMQPGIGAGGVRFDGYYLTAADGEVISAGPIEGSYPPLLSGGHRRSDIVGNCGGDFVTRSGRFLGGTGALDSVVTDLPAPVVATYCDSNHDVVLTSDGTVLRFDENPSDPTVAPTAMTRDYRPPRLTAPVVGFDVDLATGGFWLVGRDGNVYGDDTPVVGSLLGQDLSAPVVGIAGDQATGGYWLASEDGTVHAFGAPLEPQTGGSVTTAAVVAITAAPR